MKKKDKQLQEVRAKIRRIQKDMDREKKLKYLRELREMDPGKAAIMAANIRDSIAQDRNARSKKSMRVRFEMIEELCALEGTKVCYFKYD